jgi:magnesium chelatase subunit D
LNLMETLRAAAPWQVLRRRELGPQEGPRIVHVRGDDFRVTRFKPRSETTTLFVVDASGSAALHRLGEAKGAVELLLADCYVRRDRVALIAFRGRCAEVLLPPTRSLARARRCLAGLAGGGGTPLATAIEATLALADAARRRGCTPVAVWLTDGCANVALDGTGGRHDAAADAMRMARRVRAAGVRALVLDTSAHPHEAARELAREMGAIYLPLPHADASRLSGVVRAATGASAR